MTKQNRPVVRDGRLQVKKKRTDRSYLGTSTTVVPDVPPAEEQAEAGSATPEIEEVAAAAAGTAVVAPPAPVAPSTPIQADKPTAPSTAAPVRTSGAARALQQQGVQKRRVVDTDALARRDTKYAIHELRRIGILSALVVTSLIVAAITLR